MFPEGTRMARGQRAPTRPAARAWRSRPAPVVPVAVTSARCWPRKALVKTPGIVDVSIGRPIATAGRKSDELMREVEDWIESEMRRLNTDAYAPARDA